MTDLADAINRLRHTLMENHGNCEDIKISLSHRDFSAAMRALNPDAVAYEHPPAFSGKFTLYGVEFTSRSVK